MTKVLLSEVVKEMDTFEGCRVFINRRTGELYTSMIAMEDDLRFVDDDDDPLAETEEQVKLREIEESEDWLELPDKHDIHEYRIMEDFCHSIEDDHLRELLLVAISGKGAFARFKGVIDRHDIRDQWFEYRDEAIKRIAAKWLDRNEVQYVDDRKVVSGE